MSLFYVLGEVLRIARKLQSGKICLLCYVIRHGQLEKTEWTLDWTGLDSGLDWTGPFCLGG